MEVMDITKSIIVEEVSEYDMDGQKINNRAAYATTRGRFMKQSKDRVTNLMRKSFKKRFNLIIDFIWTCHSSGNLTAQH